MTRPKSYWIRLYDGVHENVKIKRVSKALGLSVHAVVGHLSALWLWTLKHRPDGILNGIEDDEICEASGFPPGKCGNWCETLKKYRLLVPAKGRKGKSKKRWLSINDWDGMTAAKMRSWDRAVQRSATKTAARDAADVARRNESEGPLNTAGPGQTRSPISRARPDLLPKRLESRDLFPPQSREEKSREEKNKSPRVTKKQQGHVAQRNRPSREALEIAARYESGTGKRVTDVSLRSIQKLLDAGHESDVRNAVATYLAHVADKQTDPQFRIEAHNFFGAALKYQLYIGRAVEPEPKMTAEERLYAWRYSRIVPLARVVQDRRGVEWRAAARRASAILRTVEEIPKHDDAEIEAPDDWKPPRWMIEEAAKE